jgi:glutathione S-transferase
VIKHSEDRIWESAIINEYLEEVFPQPPLMPETPGQRAMARIWIDFANTKFINAFYKLLLLQEPEKQQKWIRDFLNHLLFMEQEGIGKLGGDGPYWFGETVSLVDVTYYPWFERWAVLAHYRDLHLPDECDRLKRWWEAMAKRDSVQAIANSAEFYIKEYEKYANNTATGITAQEMRGD